MEFLEALKIAIFDIFSYRSEDKQKRESEPKKSRADALKIAEAKKELREQRIRTSSQSKTKSR